MSNISDEIDALAQHAEPQTELARTRLALAEARRMNAELVEALEDLLGVALSMADATHTTKTDRQAINAAKKAIRKAKP